MNRGPVAGDGFRPKLESYYDEGTDRAGIDAHLATCEVCRVELDALMRQLREMQCRDLVELASDFLEGALTAEAAARVQRHLQLCQGCRTYIEQLRQTIALVHTLEIDPARPGRPTVVPTEVREAFRSGRRTLSGG